MLVAHFVPGYFAAVMSQPHWEAEWSNRQRVALWVAALGSAVAPDLGTIVNVAWPGTISNDYLLWTHSIFSYLGLLLIWTVLRLLGVWPYFRTMLGLVAVGGLSHVLLDIAAHSTRFLYPLSMELLGAPPQHVLLYGVRGYLTRPTFLLEPLLIALTVAHWTWRHPRATPLVKYVVCCALACGCIAFCLAFLYYMPALQRLAGVK